MIMSPGLRKVALTAHITSSIGWFGAVAAFLVLAIAGLFSQNPQLVRAAYLVMGLTTWLAIVPLALVSLLSGVVSSLGTKWGLFRYYWVLLKLVITVFATIVLLIHTQPIDLLAGEAVKTAVPSANLHGVAARNDDRLQCHPSRTARTHGAVGVQATRYDPVRATEAGRAASRGRNRRCCDRSSTRERAGTRRQRGPCSTLQMKERKII